MKIKRILSFMLCVLLSLTVFSGCVSDSTEVFSVNGEKVTKGEFNFFLETMKEMIAAESDIDITDASSWEKVEIDNKKAIDVAKEKALEDAVKLIVQVQKAKSEGVVLTDDDRTVIANQKKTITDQYGGETVFNSQLKDWNVSPKIFDEIMQDYMYAAKLQAKYVAESEKINDITEEEIVAKYNSVKEQTMRESIFVKHILLMPKAATETEAEITIDMAKAKADEVMARLEAGEDFDALMREVSDDSEISYDGYEFVHNDGQMDSDFDNAAYALAIGETSKPVKTRFGYHIIRRLEPKEEIEPLEQVREAVINAIKSERYNTMVTDEWVSTASVVKDEKVFAEIK